MLGTPTKVLACKDSRAAKCIVRSGSTNEVSIVYRCVDLGDHNSRLRNTTPLARVTGGAAGVLMLPIARASISFLVNRAPESSSSWRFLSVPSSVRRLKMVGLTIAFHNTHRMCLHGLVVLQILSIQRISLA